MRKSISRLIGLVVSCLVLIVILMGFFRFGLPWIAGKTNFLSQFLSQRLGVSLALRGVTVRVENATVFMTIEEVSVAAKKRIEKPALLWQQVKLQANFFHMLKEGHFFLDGLSWKHGLAVFSFDKDNHLRLGYPDMPIAFKSRKTAVFDWLNLPISSNSFLSLKDTTVSFMRLNKQVNLRMPSLTLTTGKKHDFLVEFGINQPKNWQEASMTWGETGSAEPIKMDFSLHQLNIAPLLTVLNASNKKFQPSFLNVKSSWIREGMHWSGGWQGLNVSIKWEDNNHLLIKNSSGVLMGHNPTWAIEMRWPTIQLNSYQLEPQKSKLMIQDETSLKRLTWVFPKIKLTEWISFLSPVFELKTKNELANLGLKGAIESLQFQVKLGKKMDLQAKAFLQNLGWNSTEKVPGFMNLSGELSYDFLKKSAQLAMNIKQGEFNWPAMFPAKWEAIYCKGLFFLAKEKSNWKLSFEDLDYRDNFVTLKAEGLLNLDKDGNNPQFDWAAKFSINELIHVKNYLPYKMREHTRIWLNRAFEKGSVKNAIMSWKGPILGFPYAHNQGQWKLFVPVENLTMNYSPGWPYITQTVGEFNMHNTAITFSASTANLKGNTITNASGSIPTVVHPILYVKGQVATQLQNIQDFISVSPLPFRKDLQAVRLSGPAKVDIHLQADVSQKHGDVFLNGFLDLNKATVSLPAWNIDITDTTGLLKFTEQGITGENIAVSLLGSKGWVDMKAQKEGSGNTLLTLNLTGDLSMDALDKKMPFALLNYFRGMTHYSAKLVYGGVLDPSKNLFSFQTNMKGVTVDLPKPFDKAAAAVLPTTLTMSLAESQPVDFSFSYGQLVQGVMQLERQGEHSTFKSGAIVIGDYVPKLPVQKGLVLTGVINQLNGKTWAPVLKPFFLSESGIDKEGEQHGITWSSIHLQIKDFSWGVDQFSALQFSAAPVKAGWDINLGTKWGSGNVFFPDDKKQNWIFSFENLDVKPIFQQEMSEAIHKTSVSIPWSSVPSLELRCVNCSYGKKSLGTFDSLYQTHSQDHYELRTNWQYHGAMLASKMEWGSEDSVKIIGEISVDDLGLMINGFSHHPYIKNGSGTISFGSSWPGSPFDFSRKNLSAICKVNLNSIGVINLPKKMKSGLGIVKLVNLLSFQNSLPFVSLAEKDFYVHNLSFIAELEKEVISTSNFKLYSPTVDAQVHGNVNFLNKTIDMKLKLQPQVTGSLPMIGLIAGGPVVGILAYALNQVIEPLVGKAAEMSYTISGDLANPVVKKTHA